MKQLTNVHFPPHYYITDTEDGSAICQVRDVQNHVCYNLNGMEAADMANAIKYLLRAPFKHSMLEDLYKAHWFIEKLIDRKEKEVSNA